MDFPLWVVVGTFLPSLKDEAWAFCSTASTELETGTG